MTLPPSLIHSNLGADHKHSVPALPKDMKKGNTEKLPFPRSHLGNLVFPPSVYEGRQEHWLSQEHYSDHVDDVEFYGSAGYHPYETVDLWQQKLVSGLDDNVQFILSGHFTLYPGEEETTGRRDEQRETEEQALPRREVLPIV